MNNKTLTIIIGIPLILFITIGGYFLWDISRPVQPPEIIPTEPQNIPPLPPQGNQAINPPPNQPLWKDPASEPSMEPIPAPQPIPPVEPKITIHTKKTGDVSVDNFYQDPQTQTFDISKDAVIKDEPTYTILYYTMDQSFFIGLLGGDLQVARNTGEQELLKKLGITKEQSCKLRVSVTVPASVNKTASGADYHLSFCPDGKPLP
jgi:hypothetical protein